MATYGPYCRKCGHGAGTHGMTYCNWTYGITGLPKGEGASRTCDCDGYENRQRPAESRELPTLLTWASVPASRTVRKLSQSRVPRMRPTRRRVHL
jgi:hypothetical protein